MPTVLPPAALFDRFRAILEMIEKLKLWFPKLSLADLFAIAEAASKLQTLPDLADEAACRQWCRQAVAVLDEIADLTTVTIDDTVADAFANVVARDDLWGLAWRFVEWLTPNGPTLLAGQPPEMLTVLSEKVGIDWTKIATLIQAIIDFIKNWKS